MYILITAETTEEHRTIEKCRVTASECKEKNKQNRKKRHFNELEKKKEQEKREKSERIEPEAARCCSEQLHSVQLTNRATVTKVSFYGEKKGL